MINIYYYINNKHTTVTFITGAGISQESGIQTLINQYLKK